MLATYPQVGGSADPTSVQRRHRPILLGRARVCSAGDRANVPSLVHSPQLFTMQKPYANVGLSTCQRGRSPIEFQSITTSLAVSRQMGSAKPRHSFMASHRSVF